MTLRQIDQPIAPPIVSNLLTPNYNGFEYKISDIDTDGSITMRKSGANIAIEVEYRSFRSDS